MDEQISKEGFKPHLRRVGCLGLPRTCTVRLLLCCMSVTLR